jgi:hypothetical protein
LKWGSSLVEQVEQAPRFEADKKKRVRQCILMWGNMDDSLSRRTRCLEKAFARGRFPVPREAQEEDELVIGQSVLRQRC